MAKFTTEKVVAINARESVEQLVINEVAQLDAFEEGLIGSTYIGEFKSLLKYIEYCANGDRLPDKKMKILKRPANDSIVEYEFKSKHLRLYVIQQPSKKLIVVCGYKKNQKSDIKQLRTLKKQFVESLKAKK